MNNFLVSLKEKINNFLCPIVRNIRRKISPNPWISYEELETLYNRLKDRKNINQEAFKNFEKYLKLAKNELCSVFINYIYFWKVLHRAKVESLLLVDRDTFINEAINIINQFDNVVDDENLKKVWLGTHWDISYLNKILNNEPINVDGILPKSLQIFISNPNLSKEEELKIRTNFKNALKLLYDYFVDGNVYKLSLTYLYINYSTVGFLIIFLAFIPLYKNEILDKLAPVLVPGFLGALMGNVITYRDNLPREIFLLAIRGIIFRPFIFHILGKGVIGSFAAYLVYKASEAGIIFSLNSINPEFRTPTIVVLSFTAGFSGITMVNRFVDGVLNRITSKLEKSKVDRIKPHIKNLPRTGRPNLPPPTQGINR